MDLERDRSDVFPATSQEPWDLVRAKQRRRFPNASLCTLLEIHCKQFGKIIVRGVSTVGAAAEEQADDFLASVSEGVCAPHGRELARMSWLEFALNPLPDLFATPLDGVKLKVKDALLKRRFTDAHIGVAYDYLTRNDHDIMGGLFGLATCGGRSKTVATRATASTYSRPVTSMTIRIRRIKPPSPPPTNGPPT